MSLQPKTKGAWRNSIQCGGLIYISVELEIDKLRPAFWQSFKQISCYELYKIMSWKVRCLVCNYEA